MIAMRLGWALSALSFLGAAACGGAAQGQAFGQEWQNDDGKSIAALAQRIGKTAIPEGPGLAVGVSKAGLVAVTLDGKHHWKHAGAVTARPAIAGSVVVATSGGSLFALDGDTGRELWRTPIGDRLLRGAGDDGAQTVVSLGSGSGGGTLLLVVDRQGSVVRRWAPEPDVGTPAIASGVVFAPWGSQYVSALDVASGGETARLLARTVVSRATSIGGTLYFGEGALLRFDEAASKSHAGGAHIVKLPERELPGKPAWFPNGAAVLPPTAGATDSVRFYARPKDEGGKIGLDSERFAATYFRVGVGFHESDGTLRWVRTFPAEIIGGDATIGGFAFCDDEGAVWLTDARAGGDSGKVTLGEPVKGCVVNGGSFKTKPGRDAGTVAEQIGRAIDLKETQMATIQRFLLRELATNDDPTVTKTLLDLASDARTQPDLLTDVGSLLAARRNGAGYMLEALSRHYDFLSDVLRPPPVGPLADALSAMGEKKAAPLLAAHLNDPSDSPNDVRHAAHALVNLATGEELDAVRTFFSLYRATADADDLVAAVIDAARILVQIGGPSGAELVQRAAEDPLTHPGVKQGILPLVPKPG